ncbi:MAG: hypothetical protein R2851_10935 [Caldilineaceae bacterium]
MRPRVIAVSRATADDLVKVYAITPDKIDVVHEAAPRGGLPGSPQGSAASRARQRASGKSAPLFLGTLQPRKNLHRILDAFARIHAQVDWDLVLAARRAGTATAFCATPAVGLGRSAAFHPATCPTIWPRRSCTGRASSVSRHSTKASVCPYSKPKPREFLS